MVLEESEQQEESRETIGISQPLKERSPYAYTEMLVRFRRLNQQLQQMSRIPTGELAMLLTIRQLTEQNSPVMVSHLGRVLQLSRPAVSRMLHTLQKKSYICLSSGEEDHRCVYVRCTEYGLESIREELERGTRVIQRVVTRMGEEDMKRYLNDHSRFCSILAEELTIK